MPAQAREWPDQYSAWELDVFFTALSLEFGAQLDGVAQHRMFFDRLTAMGVPAPRQCVQGWAYQYTLWRAKQLTLMEQTKQETNT